MAASNTLVHTVSDPASPSPLGKLSNPLIFWHLLSLDAPTVAALWTWFIAAACRIHLPAASVAAMFLAVWLLYAADRLLDSRFLKEITFQAPTSISGLQARQHRFAYLRELKERHLFHRQHDRAFRWTMALSSLGLAALVPRLAPQSIRLYLILGAMLLAYFVLIHRDTAPAQPDRPSHRFPKELAVGMFFSAAAFIPTVARQPGLRLGLLPAALLFAVLCSQNCLFIYVWEHATPLTCAHPATRLALRFLPASTTVTALAGLALAALAMPRSWPILVAVALSAVLLLVLHLGRRSIGSITLRAAADACLLAPVLFLPMLLP